MRILIVSSKQDRHDYFWKLYSGLDDILIQCHDFDNALLEVTSTPYNFDRMYMGHDFTPSSYMVDPQETYDKTGTDLAEFIAREIDATDCIDMDIYCISDNPAGRLSMVKVLTKAGFRALNSPFLTL